MLNFGGVACGFEDSGGVLQLRKFSAKIHHPWLLTWMSQEVSKWLVSVGYNPNMPHL